MRAILTALTLTLSSPAQADDWYFVASLEGGAEFWTFTSKDGNSSPRRKKGNEIWITRTDVSNDLGQDGACSFDNCRVYVTLEGAAPNAGEQVKIVFSNGESMDFPAKGGEVLFDNYATVGMASTNHFVHNILKSQWVDISFGSRSHRFSLKGSAKAFKKIKSYLR